MAIMNHVAGSYASDNGLSESDVIEQIKSGQLNGYEENGYWYVKIDTSVNTEPTHSSVYKIPVAEYSKEKNIPIQEILEEIANGTRNGFSENGVWYLGSKQKANSQARSEKSTTNSHWWVIGAILSLVVIYAVSSPFLTFYQIKSGLEENDSEKLSENVDFPILRQNLKDQLNTFITREAEAEINDNPFGVLAMGLASKVVDGMVDAYVTPSGIARLTKGEKPVVKNMGNTRSTKTSYRSKEPFEKSRFTFDTISKYSVWVPNNEGGEIRFVFKRNGLDWKLTNIIVPLKK